MASIEKFNNNLENKFSSSKNKHEVNEIESNNILLK